jgi:hypothetical protein
MSDSVYVTRKIVTLKDGTIREYKSACKYQKKKAVVHKPVLELVKSINDPVKLNKVREYIIKINAGEVGNDNIQGE